MKKLARNIIHKALLGAIFTLFHPSESQAGDVGNFDIEGLNNDDANDVVNASKASPYNDVYMINSNGEGRYVSMHRSHSSHRSHRSSNTGHSSHSSHSSSSNSYHYSSSTGSSSSSSKSATSKSTSLYSGSLTSTQSAQKANTLDSYNLGDRTLGVDMKGRDVNRLVNLLSRNYYIRESWVKKDNDYFIYNSIVSDAVKRFQKDAGIKITGSVDSSTASTLESWNCAKTITIKLGVRDININDSGVDVDELIALLGKTGYAPDPSKIKTTDDGRTIYTEDIKTAVEFFQTYNDLDVTGIADERTVKKLREVASTKKQK